MVEDEALVAFSLQDALERLGFVVEHASDAKEASKILEEHHAGLSALITDIRFVGTSLDGWAIAKRARELVSAIPVIYMSGDSAHDHERLGVSQSLMLQKPFSPDYLSARVESLLPPEKETEN
jgi:DNA-binding response OmpR family regulator